MGIALVKEDQIACCLLVTDQVSSKSYLAYLTLRWLYIGSSILGTCWLSQSLGLMMYLYYNNLWTYYTNTHYSLHLLVLFIAQFHPDFWFYPVIRRPSNLYWLLRTVAHRVDGIIISPECNILQNKVQRIHELK